MSVLSVLERLLYTTFAMASDYGLFYKSCNEIKKKQRKQYYCEQL
jgi:hypothetical protein